MHVVTIVTAALAAMMQAAAAVAPPPATVPRPFFTDDLAGWIKLGSMYVAALGGVGFVMVKLAYNSHTKQLDTNTEAINGVGRRLDTESAARTECSAVVSALVTRLAVVEDTTNRHERELGEHDVKLTTFERSQHQLQSDIMQAIRETGQQMSNELHALNIKVARFEEREKFGEAMSEIASALRMMAQRQS